MLEKLLALMFSLLILFQAMLVRYYIGTWFQPAALFGLFWFLMTFIPLVILFTVPIEPLAIAYILSCCSIFSLTIFIFNWRGAYDRNASLATSKVNDASLLRVEFNLFTALTIISLLLNTLAQDISISDLIFNISTVASNYIERRYTETLNVNIFGPMSVVFTYVSAIVGGMYYFSETMIRRKAVIVILFLIPSIAVMVVQGNKGTLFLAISYFFAGIFSEKIKHNNLNLVNKDALKLLASWILLIFPFVIFSLYVRGLQDANDVEVVIHGIKRGLLSYSSSHLYAFGDWYSYKFHDTSILSYDDSFGGYGFHTFMSIFKFFGSDHYVPQGYYDEYYNYFDIIQSNIYTMYRGLVIDFGYFGSLCFMFALGIFVHLSYFLLLLAKRPILSKAIYIHFIGFLYTSFLISQFVWNSIYATFAIVSLTLWFNYVAKK